jgi:hypothetical protein
VAAEPAVAAAGDQKLSVLAFRLSLEDPEVEVGSAARL